MLWLPPMTMSLQPTLPACVIDTPLALSPYGLVATLRLAQSTRVWLPHMLRLVLDDPQFYLSQPGFVALLADGAGSGDPDAARARLSCVIEHWRAAREQLALELRERIFWPGEKQSESIMPKGGDVRFLQRLDSLSRQLDRRWLGARMRDGAQVDIRADCARDTIALAAALAEEHPLVLTTRAAQGDTLQFGTYLNDSGIPCRHLEDLTSLRLLRNAAAPLLVGAGLIEITAASGLKLAGVSLITSAAPLLLGDAIEEEAIEDEVMQEVSGGLCWEATTQESSLWEGASAAWYELP